MLSNERLSGNPYASCFDAEVIARRIACSFSEARILVVLREQTSMLLSLYLQYLQDGGVDSIEDFLDRKYDGRRPGFAAHSLEYHRLVETYCTLFGRERVMVGFFEDMIYDRANFIRSIALFVGKKLVMDESAFKRRHNPAKRDAVRLLVPGINYFARPTSVNADSALHIPGVNWTISRLNPRLGKLYDLRERRIREHIARWADGRYRDSNQRLSSIADRDLGELGYQV